MIYETPDLTAAIEQGDIFRHVPRVDFQLSRLAVVDEEEQPREMSWREAVIESGTQPLTAMLSVKPVTAIVITQNCDAVRGELLSLYQVEDYLATTGLSATPKDPKAWQSLITRMVRTNSRFFYLPPDSELGINAKQAVDFRLLLSVPRTDLENLRDQRIARLNPIAKEHFRESLAHFFRRYAYNEWYPLSREEFQAYAQTCPEHVEPYPWQEG